MRNSPIARLSMLLCLAPTLAFAQATPFDRKDWARTPSDAEIAAAWPKAVKPEEHSGLAVLDCAIDASGTPTNCHVVREDIEGQGFGEAALGLAGKFKMKRPQPQRAAIVVSLREPGYSPPDWLKRPTAATLAAVWPKAAYEKDQSGRAVISCSVDTHGGLRDCKVDYEDPPGAHFGEAALALTPQLLMRPATLNGKPIVATVRVPINFKMPPGGADHPPEEPETGTRVARRPGDSGMMSVMSAARDWSAAPTYGDVAAAYPQKARGQAIGGRVALTCGFSAKGALDDCVVVTEEPKGLGFGAAAKRLAELFRMDPAKFGDVSPDKVQVQLPIAFTAEMLGGGRPTVGKPRWAGLPTAEEVGDAFPDPARKAAIWTGKATLLCEVKNLGQVACALESETPQGYGFGEAAMKIAPYFRLTNWTSEGLPVVGGNVRIPIRFEAPPEAAAQPAPPAKP